MRRGNCKTIFSIPRKKGAEYAGLYAVQQRWGGVEG
jgi:hypothetical protein